MSGGGEEQVVVVGWGGWFPFITGGRGSNLFQLLRGNTKAAFSNIYWQLHRILALLVQR